MSDTTVGALEHLQSDDLKHTQEPVGRKEKLLGGFWDCFLFGLFMKWAVFGGFWHMAMRFGFREFIIVFVLISAGYTMLLSSLAEMVSVIAFSGYYGYARSVVHPFFGYLVGCTGVIENIATVAVASFGTAECITTVFRTPHSLEPLWWIIVHAIALMVSMQPRRSYWYMMVGITCLCALIYLFIILGSIPHENFQKYAHVSNSKVDVAVWSEILFFPCMFFSGTDLMVVTAHEVQDSKTVVPRAMLSTFAALCVIAVVCIFTLTSQAPGLSDELFSKQFIWSFAFRNMFHVPLHAAAAYQFIPFLSTLFGHMFLSGRIIKSMARSGLYPQILGSSSSAKGSAWKSPLAAMLACSGIALCLQSIAWTHGISDIVVIMGVVFTSSYVGYLGMLICFVVFRYKYSNLERTFRSPFGVPGAVVGFSIFLLAIAALAMTATDATGLLVYVSAMGLCTLYYALYSGSRQTFTPAEQQEFFKVYLINCKPPLSYALPALR